ncbi:unnamed protein product [Brachionus calyciflorus]|uniref:O-acyltransferase n=1 Tax=Brachionus calyciflorus TaxID=104777 RepID=A0A814B1K6_9BILA|nr:unnamed protein product [Brachionus calyciflorus]
MKNKTEVEEVRSRIKKDTINDKKHSHEQIHTYESVHKIRDSLLSSASGYTNYRGVLNLCVVLLVMSSGRLVLENILKYGFLVRIDVPIQFIKDPTAWPSLLAIVLSNIFTFNALKLERNLEKGIIQETTGKILCFLNIFTALLAPAIYLWYREANPVSSFFALTWYTCLSMKLVSYFQVNRYQRLKRRLENSKNEIDEKSNTDSIKKQTKNEPLIEYPDNLTYRNLYYFLSAPTLCYEINFPRSERIRKSFIIRRSGEIIFLSSLLLFLVQQWVVPILQNSKIPFRETNILKIIERLLKLAVPNHVIWLIGFYCFFHSYLNVIAEILRFGDREFYRDWWNSEDVNVFWQNWNIPVHKFCLRHIYKPLLNQGITKSQASLIVFFISAFFHEYLVSIPLRMFRIWAFLGMIVQIPFAVFVKKFLHGNYGNMAVWVSLIIGQPIAVMMYIHDYYIDYFKVSD